MRWDLTESLRDKDCNDFIDFHQETLQTEGSTVEMQWKSVHLNKTNNHDRLEELIGMQFDGTALPHERRPCTGNVQTLPGGVPGICEMRKELFFLERDLEGTTCPVQKQNYEARCLNPFWMNQNRLLWPTKDNGFDTDALTPNYCFNNFAGLADGSAYEQDTSATGAFAWKQPLFDPSTDATRYTYCLNDPLLPGQRDTFCKGGGYKVLFTRKPDRCTRANARPRATAASPLVRGATPPRFVRIQLREIR